MGTLDDLRPWVPEGARQFQVGDRVRVRLSGECNVRSRGISEWTNEYFGPVILGHPKVFNGLFGVVVADYSPDKPIPGHPVAVEFDHEVVLGLGLCVGSRFAPNELELLAPAEDGDASGG